MEQAPHMYVTNIVNLVGQEEREENWPLCLYMLVISSRVSSSSTNMRHAVSWKLLLLFEHHTTYEQEYNSFLK